MLRNRSRRRAGSTKFTINIEVYSEGLIRTHYEVDDVPEDTSELGIGYLVSNDADTHIFKRDGHWSWYPDNHVGRNDGDTRRYPPFRRIYGKKPEWPWAFDEKDFYLYGRMDKGGRGTNDFRSGKCNILYSELQISERNRAVCSVGEGHESVRLSPTNGGYGVNYFYNNFWSVPHAAPWNEIGGNDVFETMELPDQAIGGTANLFIGDTQNILMEYVEE